MAPLKHWLLHLRIGGNSLCFTPGWQGVNNPRGTVGIQGWWSTASSNSWGRRWSRAPNVAAEPTLGDGSYQNQPATVFWCLFLVVGCSLLGKSPGIAKLLLPQALGGVLQLHVLRGPNPQLQCWKGSDLQLKWLFVWKNWMDTCWFTVSETQLLVFSGWFVMVGWMVGGLGFATILKYMLGHQK